MSTAHIMAMQASDDLHFLLVRANLSWKGFWNQLEGAIFAA